MEIVTKDVTRQFKRFHINANPLLRKFGRCTLNTKLEIFASYCTNIIVVYFGMMSQKRILPNCVSHTTIVSDVSSGFRTIAVQVKCLCPATFLPSQKLQGIWPGVLLKKDDAIIMCLAGLLWTLLWCSAQVCGSIFIKHCLEATDSVLANYLR